MPMDNRIQALAQAIGADIKTLTLSQGSLAALSTTAKTSLVAAINELKTAIAAIDPDAAAGAVIDDAAGAGDTDVTWSADKLVTALAQLKSDIIDGAPAAYDTLMKIANYLSDNDTAIGGLLDAIGSKVSFTDNQTLTSVEQLTACTNIGVGDPTTDFVSLYNTAKA